MIKKFLPKAVKSAIKSWVLPNTLHMSQAGQDLWVLGEVFDGKRGGYFVDLGAHDGVEINNTYLLEKKYHWTGICVEANPDSFQRLKKNRQAICVQACLDEAEGVVDFAKGGLYGGIVSESCDNKDIKSVTGGVFRTEARTLESILIENGAPAEIDYLSIDVEGAEERILRGFNFKKYLFKCITIERPTALLREIFKENGYILIREIPTLDCFYIHESFQEQAFVNMIAFYQKKRLAFRWR